MNFIEKSMKMSNFLLDKSNYLNKNIQFLISRFIREYDMSKSNISILLYKGYINQSEFDYYASLPKLQRQIKIGLLLRDNPDVSELLKEGMIEIRNKFIIENGLDETNVLSIKNDAFFVIDKVPNKLKFDNVEFREKNVYTSYYCINNLELYYHLNQVDNTEYLDVKGMSEENEALHKEYFTDFLLTLFWSAQVDSIEETIKLLTTVYDEYINLRLDVNYYREFNNLSKFRLSVNGKHYLADYVSEKEKIFIIPTHNLNILRILSSYYTSIFQRKIR